MIERNIRYGHDHSKQYKKPIVSDFLSVQNENGEVVKRHRDLYLLLRQKDLQRKIGVEALRSYVENMLQPQTPRPSLSDEQLFQLIEPKSIDNITDAYQYSRYLQSVHGDIKSKYDELQKYAKASPKKQTGDNEEVE